MSKEPHLAPLYGLVLAGGRSSRMGMDKGNITYHEKPQKEHLYDLLAPLCARTFLSIRSDQQAENNEVWATIVDMDIYKGPFNGLLSAHSAFPGAAWLVLACDMPLVTPGMLKSLIRGRNYSAVATAMATRTSGLPEPLAAIWEPHGLEKAANYLLRAETNCPRKFLLRNDTSLVYAKDDRELFNANSLEEYREVRSKISGT